MKKIYVLLLIILFGCFLGFLFFHTHQKPIVAVLDTGIDPTHPLFTNRLIKGIDVLNKDFQPNDQEGHGTHVAGIIAQETHHTMILPIRTIHQNSVSNWTPFAVFYAIVRGADVINMSFHQEPSFWMNQVIRFGAFKGVVFVAASGNQGKKEIDYPASHENVLAIGSIDPLTQTIYTKSNMSSQIDYVAPGVNIQSAGLNHATIRKTGTSMASAYVAGVLGRLKEQNPSLKGASLVRALKKTATPTSTAFWQIDQEKAEAIAKKKPYLSLITKVSASTFTVQVDSLSLPDATLYIDNRFIKTISLPTKPLTFPMLKNGRHVIKLMGTNHHKRIEKQHIVVVTENK